MRQEQQLTAPLPKPKGGALVGVAIAVVGVLAAAFPSNAVIQAVNQVAPEVAGAVATLVTTVGAVIAAVSEPRLQQR